MRVAFSADNMPRVDTIDGLTLEIGGLEIPPLDLGGKVHIRGLSSRPAMQSLSAHSLPASGLPGDPARLFFAGSVQGTLDTYKVKVLLAFSLAGIAGVCLDFNAGNLGIPLDAGALGGILLSGASGGVAFNQGDADPCDFTAWLDADGKPKPGIISWPPVKLLWSELSKAVAALRARAEAFARQLKPASSSSARPFAPQSMVPAVCLIAVTPTS